MGQVRLGQRLFPAAVKRRPAGGRSDGAGIGLAIVDKIVRTYGGEITVKNDDGACFEFVLKDVRVN